ncbi:esterase/lipase family protein [Nitriliruptor alkaliphilus]|uniref:esterase/lipase family protein n=1 Tax=Nitriliruptor alkaliphilus TaxID=427918 RepID=UPI001B801C59|nr:alpha/beta fold hydrolase [Nitriliruptor alkaliphilus]
MPRSVAWLLAITLAATWAVVTPPVADARPEPDPIVFVHGYSGGESNWSTMVKRFEAAGWDADRLVVWPYNWNQRNVTTARQLADEIARVRDVTGAEQVTLITHSMGGLSSRYYLSQLGGTEFVGTWVSLGGPNHGTNWAYGCWSPSCFDMRPGSALLAQLNDGPDPTPGPTEYATYWSRCDAVISPSDSTVLPGADNTHVGCVGHLELLWDRTTFDLVLDRVR